jgi:hypothetical protein
MQRAYTPILHYLSPPVVYFEAHVQLHFNPKSIMNIIKDVEIDNLPFVQAKIGNSLINFENYVSSTTRISSNVQQAVRGVVGD